MKRLKRALSLVLSLVIAGGVGLTGRTGVKAASQNITADDIVRQISTKKPDVYDEIGKTEYAVPHLAFYWKGEGAPENAEIGGHTLTLIADRGIYYEPYQVQSIADAAEHLSAWMPYTNSSYIVQDELTQSGIWIVSGANEPEFAAALLADPRIDICGILYTTILEEYHWDVDENGNEYPFILEDLDGLHYSLELVPLKHFDTLPDNMLNVYEYAESKGLHLIDTTGFYSREITAVPDHAKFEGYITGYRDGFLEQFNAGETVSLCICTAFSHVRLNLKPAADDLAPLDALLGAFADENSAVTYGRVDWAGFAAVMDYGLQKDTADRVCALLAENPAAAACVQSIEYTPVFLTGKPSAPMSGEIRFMLSNAQLAEAETLTLPAPWHLDGRGFAADREIGASDLEALFAAVEQAFPGTVLKPSPLDGAPVIYADKETVWRAPGNGDLTGDGETNIGDAVALARFNAEDSGLDVSALNMDEADLNADGTVDLLDLAALLRALTDPAN